MKIRFKKTKEKTIPELKSEIKFASFWAILLLIIGFGSSLWFLYISEVILSITLISLIVGISCFYLIDITNNLFEIRIKEVIMELKKE